MSHPYMWSIYHSVKVFSAKCSLPTDPWKFSPSEISHYTVARPEKLPREWKYHRLLAVQWCYHLHAMTIMSPSTNSREMQWVTFMLREVHVDQLMMLHVNVPCQSSPALTFPVSCLCLYCKGHLSARVVIQILQIACSVHVCAWGPLPYAFKI